MTTTTQPNATATAQQAHAAWREAIAARIQAQRAYDAEPDRDGYNPNITIKYAAIQSARATEAKAQAAYIRAQEAEIEEAI